MILYDLTTARPWRLVAAGLPLLVLGVFDLIAQAIQTVTEAIIDDVAGTVQKLVRWTGGTVREVDDA